MAWNESIGRKCSCVRRRSDQTPRHCVGNLNSSACVAVEGVGEHFGLELVLCSKVLLYPCEESSSAWSWSCKSQRRKKKTLSATAWIGEECWEGVCSPLPAGKKKQDPRREGSVSTDCGLEWMIPQMCMTAFAEDERSQFQTERYRVERGMG